ncbi:hypothetical protein FISHEDRAFT_71236 [Fistulina hepatica ATCC 64428]|nr:hypothetical protein FISHEDRAFT_71236 [Fistulina hepatica ATCC 64428]
MAAIYAVYTSPTHPPIPNHLPTLIVTPHGQPSNILYSYLHTNFNAENYLLTPSPQGDLCVAKLFPPPPKNNNAGKGPASDPGHSSPVGSRVVRCEASRNLKWSIMNTGVISPIYKLSLPSPDSPDLPLFQISKPNPNAAFWSMFYFAYAGHNIPPKRIEFGKIQKNPPGPNGGGTRISITGKTPEEKAVWQTLGEGNEDCVEWVVLCAALNLLDDEIMKAAEKNPPPMAPVSLRDPGPTAAAGRPGPPPHANTMLPPNVTSGRGPPPGAQQPPPRGYPPNGPPRGGPPSNGPPRGGLPPNGPPRGGPPPSGPSRGGPPPSGPSRGGPPPNGPPRGGPPPNGHSMPQANMRGGPPPNGYGPPPNGHGMPPPNGHGPPGKMPRGGPPNGHGPPPNMMRGGPPLMRGGAPPQSRSTGAPQPQARRF